MAYFANTAEESGLEEMPTIAVKGREYARGVALRDPVDGAIYMTGAGRDIWWVKDDFNYLPEDADGDRTVVVHVGSMSNPQPNQWSKAGIMFRAGPEPDAAMYMVLLTGSRGICPILRSARGAHMWGDRRAWPHMQDKRRTCPLGPPSCYDIIIAVVASWS